MANQIVVSAGAKVRNLSGVLTATSGVVSFLPIDVSMGIPQLDVNGKILVSQLPNSVMEYKGTWNAATNTPTLVNGTGNQGDVYLCNVAGTVNFGAGAITFGVGDSAIYSGSIWQKAGGSTGSVTSVGLSTNAGAITIGSSPITSAGTITANFNGTNLQYVNGAGNLTTFPILTGYVTAVSGTAPVVSSGGTTPAISMAAASGSVDGYLLATDFAIFNAKQSALTFSSPLVNTSGTISIPAATTSINGYLASADFTTFNNKQNAITLTTTGTSGASTLVGATLNIPNYGSALTGYVPYTGATQDVDLGAFKLNAQSLHIKGTAGNGHLGLKHQSASATASANEVSLFADSLGDLGWLNGNLYLSKFITSGNTAARSYTFPNATCNIPNDSLVVHLAGTETITGAKTFSGGVTFSSTLTTTSNLTFSNSGFTLVLQPPTLSVNRTVTLPNGTGTLALTSDISYPVSSVFGRTGAVVATSGDYTTTQVTEGTNLYYTDVRARASNSFVAGSGAYNSTTGVITIPTNNNQITNGSNYITLGSLSAGVGISYNNTTGVITNSAPDQVVALTASTGISVTGTYPNFTITNTSPSSGGTVTSVAALTIGTSGTDLSSTVATSTTTPVITLNVPTASAANRGALSSADWTTFNNKASTASLANYLPLAGGILTGPLGGTSASFSGNVGAATISYGSGTSTGALSYGSSLITLEASSVNTTISLRPTGTGGVNTNGFPFTTGALGGTSASFSSSVSVKTTEAAEGLIILGRSDDFAVLRFKKADGTNRFTLYSNPNDLIIDTPTIGTAMAVTQSGNVRIGNFTDAGYKLDVNGTGRFSSSVTAASIYVPSTTFGSIPTPSYQTIIKYGQTNTFAEIQGGNLNNNDFSTFLKFRVNGTASNTPVDALTLANTGAATFYGSVTATSFFESSDSRLKTLIQDNYQTKGIASITPKLYTKNGKVELGYYAQDFIGVLDSAISKDEDEMLSLSYREVLVAKVYALEQRIKELETK